MSTIAAIIPTHNRAHTLMRALSSVYAQQRTADEVIVVDDGSTDDTRQLVEQLFPEARYIHQAQQGVSSARNTGIKNSRAEWIALLDSDDEWLPHKLAQQMDCLRQNPSYHLIHSNEIWIRDGRRVNPMNKHQKHGGWIFEHCLPLCAISPSSVILHRELLDDIGLFDETLPACEDYDLWLRICCRHPVLYSEEPLIIKYGGHRDQLSRRHWGMDRFRIRALERLLSSTALSKTDRRATIHTLRQKCAIYLQGARKRNKQQDVVYYENLLQRYRGDTL